MKTGTPSPAFSPDGRWIASMDAESGMNQVYVRAYPDRGEKCQVSTNGGSQPIWSRTRQELLYQGEDNRVMAASYSIRGNSFVPEKPRIWTPRMLGAMGLGQTFDLAPDGERIVAFLPVDTQEFRDTLGHVTLTLNFFDELRRRVGQ